MIFGWKNNPEWVKYYKEKEKERQAKRLKNIQHDHESYILALQRQAFRKKLGSEDAR